MLTTTWGYRAAVRLGIAIAPALGIFDPRLATAIRARRHAGDRLLQWARGSRDRGRPLGWFHAASFGEGLQAESVLLAFRRLRPDCQVVYTHFSPSAEVLAGRIQVDVADYLPDDLPANVDRLLGALEPDLLIFAKLDVWPELATRAAASGVQVAIVAATVRPGSSRLRWPARNLLEAGYRAVTAAAAISEEDANRLTALGVSRQRIRVLGDPRFDSVAHRVSAVPSTDPLLRWGRGAATMVAGSTWPADEITLLHAFGRLHQTRPDARLILVPHEPSSAHLDQVERTARSAGLPPPVRLSAAERPSTLLLVDRVGVLAALYGAGTMAFVGGGFGRTGLHSVLEPAAWALPVAFGPHWRDSRDARLLLESGAAIALPQGGREAPIRALHKQWESWIIDQDSRQAQGKRGRAVVEQGLGASERSAKMLAELISARHPRRSPPGGRSDRPSRR